jgi:hypothetical protein
MVRSIFLGAVAALVLGSFLTLGSNSARAQLVCDDALVAGDYGINFDGFFNQRRQNGNTQIFIQKPPIRGIGTLTLNDDATINDDATVQVLIKGFVADTPQVSQGGPRIFEFTGTWFVNDDCTGEIDFVEFDAVIDWIFVAVKGGTELFIVSNGSLGQAQAKRLAIE